MATKTLEKHEAVEKDIAPVPVDLPPPVITQFAVNSIDELTLDPDAVQGSRHAGPLLSGAPEDGAAGIAMLHKRVKITSATGAFSVPVRFPASSILVQIIIQTQQVFNGTTPKLNFGTTLNGLDIYSQDLTTGPSQYFSNVATILPSNWTIYLSLVPGGATQGKVTAMITYSVPAKTLPS